jgi:hypothetical protein
MSLANWFRDWNDVNVTSAKAVLVAIMQFMAFGCIQLMWCVAMIVQLRHWTPPQDVDFHIEFLYLELGALLALSGINLGSRIVNRTTDVDYQLAKNAGKSATVNVSGDNPNVSATIGSASTTPEPAALPPFTRLTRRQSAQLAAVQPGAGAATDAVAIAGARSIVTDHDRGVI